MYNGAYASGVGVGLLVALIFKVIYARTTRGRKAAQYDERQEKARMRAYASAFWALSVYTLANGLFVRLTEIVWADAFMQAFIGFCLAGLVAIVQCIRDDAYFSLRERPGLYLKVFALVFVANLGIGIAAVLASEPIVAGGMLTVRSLNFFFAVVFLVILLALWIKRLRDRGERDA